jgi:hypothetical protein
LFSLLGVPAQSLSIHSLTGPALPGIAGPWGQPVDPASVNKKTGGSGKTVAHVMQIFQESKNCGGARPFREITPPRSHTFSTPDRQDFFEK